MFGCLLLRARIVGHVQAGNADRAGCPGDLHQAVQNDSGRFDDLAVFPFRLCFEADAVDRTIHFGNAQDVGDELTQAIVPGEVDRLEANVLGVGEPLFVHVSDQHGCRAKNLRGRRGREADRPCAGDVDRRSDADLGGDGSVESRRQNIGKAGQITDLFYRLRLVRKLQQVEIGVGHHHVVGLPADPSAHIDISIGASGAVGVDVKADAGVTLSTGPTAAACDVERDRHQIADLEILDVMAFLDDFARDFVSEHHTGRRRRAAPDHVLVGAADIRRYDLENDAVIDRLSCWIAERRKVDVLNFDAARFEVNHPTIRRHP